MRIILALSALTLACATPARAQDAPPRGSYEQQCRDIRMNGSMLSATCGGVRGGAQSSINILSCSGDIGVDARGGLTCRGPGGGRPPIPGPPPRPEPPYGGGYRPGDRWDSASLFAKRDWRGRSIRIDGPIANLANSGLNDRVRSIRLERRSGPWIVCSNANYRGRCTTIRASVADTRQIGLGDSISSLRPAR